MRRARIAYHGHCFDGMSSAAVLTRVLRELEDRDLAFEYRGLDHAPGGSFVPEDVLDGELNAVVDFRYSTSPRLHYWFDHHATGIVGDEERAHFAADQSGHKVFEPHYGSCCKLIADVAAARWNISMPELAPLIAAADMIDAARFPDARTAVELAAPELQLMTVIESHGDDAFLSPRIAALAAGTQLAQIAGEPEAQRLFAPLRAAHEQTIDAIASVAREQAGVVVFDLIGSGSDRFNKFVPYYLHPSARYAVAVTAGATRAKVSVGSNPWLPPGAHDIGAICARYGGGGHRAVGAISLRPDQQERARAIAQEIARELEGR
jgi:hypothetical protein